MSEQTNPAKGKHSKKIIALAAGAVAVVAAVGIGLAVILGGNSSGAADGTEPANTTAPVQAGVMHCICGCKDGNHLPGCDGTEYSWNAWSEANALPITPGFYYLDTDVELLTSENVANVTSSGAIYLDLNGHSVHSATRVYRIATANTNVDLTFLDTVGTGKVTMDTHPNGATLVMLDAAGDKTVTFYGGTYDGSALEAMGENGDSPKNGTVMRIGGGKLNIHGGVFIGGKRANAGGTVYVQNGEFNMTGGEIKNGSANNAGNVMVRTSVFNMTGGKIHDGVAKGAENSRGGNIFSDKGTIKISGTAEVFDGAATYLGENIFTNLISELYNEGKVYFTNKEGHGIYPAPLNPEDPNHTVCICGGTGGSHLPGCDGTKYAWRPWTETDSLPITSGRFYLTSDIQLANTAAITSAEEVYLDLNGHKIYSSTRVYQMASAKIDDNLTILDSVGGGGVVMRSYKEGGTFAAIGNTGGKTVTIYGGTFDASAINCGNKNGAFMRVGSKSATLKLYRGTIIGGTANTGGAVHVNAGTFVMGGGTVRSGKASNGGNIVVVSGGKFNMTGGSLYNGSATAANGRGGNIFNNASTVTVSGGAKVYDGKATTLGDNIFSMGNYTTNVKTGCAYFTNSEGDGIYPIPPAEEDPNHMACICGSKTSEHLPGCDGTKFAWRPWSATDSLPGKSGKYYLTKDVNISVTTMIQTNEDIYLDLNGHTINATSRIYQMAEAKANDTLTVLDSVGGGKVVMTGYTGGGTFAAIGNIGSKTVTIYGGTFDASAIDCGTNNGAFFRVGSATSKLNIRGGEIIGGKANSGGALHINAGNVTMTGGKVSGGSAGNGGNIVVVSGGKFNMTGGEVLGGKATAVNGRGGNIFNNASTVTVSGDAKVYDGKATTLGDNIFSLGDYTTNVEKGCAYYTGKTGDGIYPAPPEEEDPSHQACICGSKTSEHLPGCDGTKYAWTPWSAADSLPGKSGKYYLTKDVNISATTMIQTNEDIYLDLNGHTINATSRIYQMAEAKANDTLTVLDSVGGGKVVMTGYTGGGTFAAIGNTGNKTVTIYGGTFDASAIDCGTNNGAFMRVGSATSKLNIHGGTIIGGKAPTANGGALHINAGNVTMTGGTVRDGSAGNGGNIVVVSGGSFTMTGGEVLGGKATAANGRGGNIFNNASTVTVSGDAKVYNGTATTDGANIYSLGDYTTTVEEGCAYFTEGSGDGIYPSTVVTDETHHCICGSKTSEHLPGCDGTVQTWTAWNETDAMPSTAGYYYLNKDVTTSTTNNLSSARNIFIDLNGHTVTSTANRLYILNNSNTTLTLLDTVGTGKIVMTGSNGGALAHLPNANNKALTIYGGTYDASGVTVSGGRNGAVISTTGNSGTAKVNIHGGTIIGGSTDTSYAGGAVYIMNGATLTMTGGEVKNGKSISNGGNIYLDDGAVAVISGGTVSGGSSVNSGNVYLTGSTTVMTMTGGVIKNGVANNGGNILVANGATLTVSGGEIFGGKATAANGRGGNIFNNASKVTISGSAKVYNGTAVENGANVFSLGTYTTSVASGCAYFTEGTGDGVYPSSVPVFDVAYHCTCGSKTSEHLPDCDGKAQTWTAWNETDAMPTTAGYYYLNKDVTTSTTNNLTTARDIFIDLNGHTVTSTANRLYILNNSNTTLTLLDTAGTGKIVMTGSNGGALAHLVNANNKVLTIYGGTYDASAMTISGGRSGGIISTASNSGTATINIHGGTLIGAKTASGYFGGAIHVTKGAVLNVTGGEIKNGSAVSNGGNIYLENNAVMNMSGGKISGGSATNGGNVYCKDTAQITVTGGEIAGGTANNGGNIALAAGTPSLTVSGGAIHDGKATAENGRGGNIFNNNAKVKVSGSAKVYDGTAVQNGPNIFSQGDSYVADIASGCAYFTEGTGDGIYPVSAS